MHIRLLAVGARTAGWVNDAVTLYSARLPREWRFRIDAIETVKRARNQSSSRAIETEGQQLLARMANEEQIVLLDETGKQMTSRALAARLGAWQADGRNLCFVIGGPDGVSSLVSQRADFCWSLSKLTLPHGLARVLLVEQLYRASTMSSGHPYHRD